MFCSQHKLDQDSCVKRYILHLPFRGQTEPHLVQNFIRETYCPGTHITDGYGSQGQGSNNASDCGPHSLMSMAPVNIHNGWADAIYGIETVGASGCGEAA